MSAPRANPTAKIVIFTVAIAVGCLCPPGPALGAVYVPAEPTLAPSGNTPLFLSVLNDLRGLRNPQNQLRKEYLSHIAELEAKERRGGLTTADRVNLSGYYIRLEEFEKAVAVLDPAAADPAQANFMVLCNLAAANEHANRLDRAISYADMALKKWPAIWPGMSRTELYWLGRAERYHLDLLKARYVEATRQPLRGGVPEQPDALFGRVNFAAKGAPYRAGDMDEAQMIELPDDALRIVQQLLLWSPNDLRLHWLFAELLNAQGGPENIMAAYGVLNRLISADNYSNATIRAHRNVLKSGAEAAVLLNQALAGDRDPNAWVQLMWYAQPRGTTLEPGAGALASQASWGARAAFARRMRAAAAPPPTETPAAPAESAKPGASWLPDPRQLIVSFAAGVLVTLLGVLQIKEFRRRHAAPSAAPKSEA